MAFGRAYDPEAIQRRHLASIEDPRISSGRECTALWTTGQATPFLPFRKIASGSCVDVIRNVWFLIPSLFCFTPPHVET